MPAPNALDILSLPGMDPAHGYTASAEEILAAISAAAPSQDATWQMVTQLLPLLIGVTADGPLLGFALDLETTGRGWTADRITELAVVDLASGETFSSLSNHEGHGRLIELPADVQRITGITPSMLQFAPSERWVALALLVWVYQRCRAVGQARPTLIGHNAKSFDRYFLARHLAYNGCLVPPSWCLVDTLHIAKDWHPDAASCSLQALSEAYGTPRRDAHRALNDTLGLVEVFAAMLRARYPGHPRPPPYLEYSAAARWEVQQALNDGRLHKAVIAQSLGGAKSAASPRIHIEPLLPFDKAMALLNHLRDPSGAARRPLAAQRGGAAAAVVVAASSVVATASISGSSSGAPTAVSGSRAGPGTAAASTSTGGSRWTMCDVLLHKTSHARAAAMTVMNAAHGSAFRTVQLSASVVHPPNPWYNLPEPGEPLPSKNPLSAVGPMGLAVSQGQEPASGSLLRGRRSPAARTGAPEVSGGMAGVAAMASTASSSSQCREPSPGPHGMGQTPPPAGGHQTVGSWQAPSGAGTTAHSAPQEEFRGSADVACSSASGALGTGSTAAAESAPSGVHQGSSEGSTAASNVTVAASPGAPTVGAGGVSEETTAAAARGRPRKQQRQQEQQAATEAQGDQDNAHLDPDDPAGVETPSGSEAAALPSEAAAAPVKRGRRSKVVAPAAADPADTEDNFPPTSSSDVGASAPSADAVSPLPKRGRKAKVSGDASVPLASAESQGQPGAEDEPVDAPSTSGRSAEAGDTPTRRGRKPKAAGTAGPSASAAAALSLETAAAAVAATVAPPALAKAPSRKARKAKSPDSVGAGAEEGPPLPPDGWSALAAPFAEEPFRSAVWQGALPRKGRKSVLDQLKLAAEGGRLATPHSLLLHVPRAVVVHRQQVATAELAGRLEARDALRAQLGNWQEVRDALKEVEGIPVAFKARLRHCRVTPLPRRGHLMTAQVLLSPGQIAPEEPEPVACAATQPATYKNLERTADIEASWFDFDTPRGAGLHQRKHEYEQPGREWVVRGILAPKCSSGPRFTISDPAVLPASSFQPSTDLVVATYRAASPLEPQDVAEVAAGVLDALKKGDLELPDPLPPSARTELQALLSGTGPASFPAALPNTTAPSPAPGQLPARPASKPRISRTSHHLVGSPTPQVSLDSGSGSGSGGDGFADGTAVAASSPLPEVDLPGLVESYDILHRPKLEHMQELCVVRPPQQQQQQGEEVGQSAAAPAPLPPVVLTRYQLAGRVVAFHELFFSQLQMQMLRRTVRGPNWAPVSADDAVSAARAALGFQLTGAQERAVREVLDDMRADRASTMYRLLQGDVGSGKTAVALLALVAAAASGLQGLLVVPTTVLAQQHHAGLCALLEELPVAERRKWGLMGEPLLLIGDATTKERRLATAGLADGSIRLAVGTHALLNITDFRALGLLVLDESHKFGVVQMEKLNHLIALRPPHLLNMSATPIPRTLAAAMYGHMDVSRLDERPPGRTPVATRLVQDDTDMQYTDPGAVREMDAMWEEVLQELTTGDPPGRAFVVYPLREARAAAAEDLKNAEDQLAVLAARFEPHGITCQLLHGKTKDKEAVLESFRRGDVRLLVCTTVVEVGVDVPEATVVVVEHAERFGLAQLHQLRGRVGRGSRPGRCFLCVPFGDQATRERLGIMEVTNDGFVVAEWDLEQRGIGHLFGPGTKQHGRMDVSPLTEAVIDEARGRASGVELVEAARRAAAAVAREWEGETQQQEGEEEEEEEEDVVQSPTLKALSTFRPEALSSANALAV